jgi:hypothetical protein
VRVEAFICDQCNRLEREECKCAHAYQNGVEIIGKPSAVAAFFHSMFWDLSKIKEFCGRECLEKYRASHTTKGGLGI